MTGDVEYVCVRRGWRMTTVIVRTVWNVSISIFVEASKSVRAGVYMVEMEMVIIMMSRMTCRGGVHQ